MTRQPAGDERSVVPRLAPVGRVYVVELAAYLHHSIPAIQRFARRHHLLKIGRRGGYDAIYWVTEVGAARIIAHFRAIQGQWAVEGKDFHRVKDMDREKKARSRARLRAKALTEQAALNARSHLTIAFSRAEAEDEPTSEAE